MSWDDGKHTKVKKIKLTFDDVINSIEVEYDGTSLKSQPRGTIGTKSDEFTLGPDEYITEVNGYYKTVFSGEVITALTFKTNKKTYGPYGNKSRNYFSANAPKDNQIVGFLGTSGNVLNSIDVHFAPILRAGSTGTNPGGTTPGGPSTTPGGTETSPGGLETTAGDSETTFGPGGAGISPEGPGTIPGTTSEGFGTNPGSAGTAPGTNLGGQGTTPGAIPGGSETNPGDAETAFGANPGGPGTTPGTTPGGYGTNPGGAGTALETNPGGAENNPGAKPGSGSDINSNLQKVEVQGGKGGNQWDDGANHDSVTKIHVVYGISGIEQIKFDYLKNGEIKEGPFHGVKRRGSILTIEIDHPNEYLVSVKGWYDSTNIIQGIQFITNTKTFDYSGYEFTGEGKEFSLEVKDKKIIGFHGFADSHLNSLGAYFAPITSTSLKPAKKLKAIGGDEGTLWDDGVFDGVRKVHVGQYHDGVSFIKIEYNKGSQVIIGDDHGKESMLGVETFELDYPSEYITALQGYYDNIQGEKGGLQLVTSLIFVTNKQISDPYGLTGGEFFEIKEEGHKIVGFHGKAGDWVHQIGVYVVPITN